MSKTEAKSDEMPTGEEKKASLVDCSGVGPTVTVNGEEL
jgi:hypothetical protein